jgi:RhtB (resistance to homoserine/threonine) family protein
MTPLLLTVALVHLMAVMSPGPDLVVCIKNTLKHSRWIGVWTALGFACGVLVHITYCLLGIALIISQSVLLFNIVKLMGAAYLIYLGVKALLSTSKSKLDFSVTHANLPLKPWQAWRDGFITNLLNPKATLYFLGFFSVVIPPDLAPQSLVIISLTLFFITLAWFSLVAMVMTVKPIRDGFLRIEKRADQVFGGILILLGLKVATAKL